MSLRLLLMPLLGAALASPAWSQQPIAFFKERIKLQDAEIRAIGQGQVVTKILDSGDKYGLLVFGAVYVNAPIERFASIYRDVEKLEQEKVYLNVQEFGKVGSPPKPSDFERLTLEKSDVDELKDCKPGDCEVQIITVEEFQKLVNWNSPDRYEQANKAARQRILDGMSRYMKSGLKELGAYHDRKNPLGLYEATKAMVDRSFYLPKDKAPEIYRHVIEYPQGKMNGAEDVFYWEKIDFGQGPVIRVNHVTLFPQGVGPVKSIAANKQLYASKYMRVALQMFYCVPDERDPKKPGFFLIEMNDSVLPDFGGLKLGVVRKIASGKAEEGTRDTLAIFKRRMTGGT